MDAVGEELLKELKSINVKIQNSVQEQFGTDKEFHKSVINIKDRFFKELLPKVKNNSVQFFEVNNEDENQISDKSVGMYIFVIKLDDLDDFRNDWNKFKTNIKVPSLNMNNSPYKLSINKKDWYVLYVGKSHNLKQRINQHLIECSDSTYSLRLNEFNKIFPNKYEMKFVCLSSDNKEIIPLLYPIEKSLHKQFTPLVGTSR